jgi:hypothetical protein
MDGQEYDRIADLLMQIRKKYANLEPKNEFGQHAKNAILDYINAALHLNDEIGKVDAKGLL